MNPLNKYVVLDVDLDALSRCLVVATRLIKDRLVRFLAASVEREVGKIVAA